MGSTVRQYSYHLCFNVSWRLSTDPIDSYFKMCVENTCEFLRDLSLKNCCLLKVTIISCAFWSLSNHHSHRIYINYVRCIYWARLSATCHFPMSSDAISLSIFNRHWQRIFYILTDNWLLPIITEFEILSSLLYDCGRHFFLSCLQPNDLSFTLFQSNFFEFPSLFSS